MTALWYLAQPAQEAEAQLGLFELFSVVLTGLYALVHSYGLAIILLTVVIRIVLLPLSIKQTRSMREMQRIQPEIKKIQAKHKGNRQKMNEEMMALYKEHGVNPFGGCLPLAMQMPVLIGLFYVVRSPLKYLGYSVPRGSGAEVVPPTDYVPQAADDIMQTLQNSQLTEDLIHHALRVNQFLGLRLDCSSNAALRGEDPSRIGEVCGSGLISALPYLVLVALMGFTTWYQQKQMEATRGNQNDPAAQQMQMFGKIMPLMLMFFAYTFPTGVVLYWLTTNVWTIGQQQLMLRVAPPEPDGKAPPVKEPAEGDGAKSRPPRRTKAATGGSPPQPAAAAGRSSSSKKKKKKR